MTVAAAHFPEIGRTSVGRLVATWILLLAFALQSYVTQTHVHRALIPAASASAAQAAHRTFAQSASPVDDEAVACAFCQAIAAAGAFLSPAGVAVPSLLVQAEAAAAAPTVVGLAIAPAGFSWRSRAPPQS